MKAVRLHSIRTLSVEAVGPPPPPRAGEAHLKVLAAGICGSDIHNYLTGRWLSGPPHIAGHELTGEVLALGEGVATLAIGDRVAVDSRFYCGTCDHCRAGRNNICRSLGFVGEACDGGFAEEVVLPASLLHRIDPSIDARAAAMTEPLAVALHAVRRLAPPQGEPVLVVGCGTIGGLIALILSTAHDGPILITDRNAARAALVADSIGARVVELTEELLATIGHVFDASGNVAVIETVIRGMRSGGGLALVGISHGTVALDPNLLVEKETTLYGCHAFTTDDLIEASVLAGRHADILLRWIDAEYALDDVPRAYERIIAGAATGLKSIVLPHR
ncbi:(R,R)-butanediol dehydrogenase / meso-butanediol dehydrogenase / diacetyl reductase [Kaistia soli DSM 19436]|uniref:(R,R)-butanediol dehydrogenase / meso-butanediol dehydrogenase / diacetyl reductase n=1 Tax=Kaistia soli DSM 19436 TaxID=1122133 RepID=A0A1M5DIJ6_9HYPH|nr:alcohol dehydrogenase catalytic domain-containing protein [Kaistia soli]SHF66817.1 (R,R)-butanediol dehydrogenase / meso-butanediol dehydrogenase / diacetyl reductase [Kaistia soli DSM 19436]